MTERWRRELGKLDDVGPSPDLLERAKQGPRHGELGPSAGHRALIIVLAFLVFAAGAGFLWRAFSGPIKPGSVGHGCVTGFRRVDVPAPGNYGSYLAGVQAFSSKDVWAVGLYSNVPAEWLRTLPSPSSTPVPGGIPPEVRSPLVVHWDGASWSMIPAPNVGVRQGTTPTGGSSFRAVSGASSNDLWAVGGYGAVPLIEHWDGNSWSVIPSPRARDGGPNNALVGVAAITPRDAWAIGPGVGGVTPVIERWDGASWNVSPVPGFGAGHANPDAISASSPPDVWVVGQRGEGAFALHFDGTSWSVVDLPQTRGTRLWSVAAVSGSDAWAVGAVYDHGSSRALVEHWDGARWSLARVPSLGKGSELAAVSAAGPNDVWASGWGFDGSNWTPALLHYDGANWSVVSEEGPEYDGALGLAAIPSGGVWVSGATSSDAYSGVYEECRSPSPVPTAPSTQPTIDPAVQQALYDRAMQMAAANGDPNPTSIQAVLTTRNQLTALFNHVNSTHGLPAGSAIFVQITGSFVCNPCKILQGNNPPTGHAMWFVVPASGPLPPQPTDWGLEQQPIDLTRLGAPLDLSGLATSRFLVALHPLHPLGNPPASGGDFKMTDAWGGTDAQGNGVTAWSGASGPNTPHPGRGEMIVHIARDNGDGTTTLVANKTYVAPGSHGTLTILAARGPRLLLRAGDGTRWLFDLTGSFTPV